MPTNRIMDSSWITRHSIKNGQNAIMLPTIIWIILRDSSALRVFLRHKISTIKSSKKKVAIDKAIAIMHLYPAVQNLQHQD